MCDMVYCNDLDGKNEVKEVAAVRTLPATSRLLVPPGSSGDSIPKVTKAQLFGMITALTTAIAESQETGTSGESLEIVEKGTDGESLWSYVGWYAAIILAVMVGFYLHKAVASAENFFRQKPHYSTETQTDVENQVTASDFTAAGTGNDSPFLDMTPSAPPETEMAGMVQRVPLRSGTGNMGTPAIWVLHTERARCFHTTSDCRALQCSLAVPRRYVQCSKCGS